MTFFGLSVSSLAGRDAFAGPAAGAPSNATAQQHQQSENRADVQPASHYVERCHVRA